MSDEGESSSYRKGKPIRKDESSYKRKRTTMKEAQEDGKLLLACEFCPASNQKFYQSYPALYFHVREKHPGHTVTSAKSKNKNDPLAPVLKLKTILKANDPEREETERELIDLKQFLCLTLSQSFARKRLVDLNQIGERAAGKHMGRVASESFKLAQHLNYPEEPYREAEKGEIFREYFTKIAPISFGKDIVRYFAKNVEFSSKLYFQVILMESLDQCLIDKAKLRDL
jgi:hypothetical protein